MKKWHTGKGYRLICAYCHRPFFTRHWSSSTADDKNRCCSGSHASKYRNAGFQKQYTQEQLILILRKKAEELGQTPMKESMRKPSAATFATYFGSWSAAIIAAGLIPRMSAPIFMDERIFIRPTLRFQILKRDKFTCQYCGGTPRRGYLLHVDHKIPRSKGGKTLFGNLITACIACNLGKGTELA